MMKPGLVAGQKTEVEILVSQNMFSQFDGQVVHELYSTSSLVHHMEWAARNLILPYLEPHETTMGNHVDVSHLTMTLPNSRVRIVATFKELRDSRVVCDIEAFNGRGKVARGTITQAIVDKIWLDKKLKELTIIKHLSGQVESAVTTAR